MTKGKRARFRRRRQLLRFFRIIAGKEPSERREKRWIDKREKDFAKQIQT
jgi:hypothetical protein